MSDLTETSSFRIDPINLCLWRIDASGKNERLNLAPKAFDVLRYLFENSGRLVTHEELLAALWRDVHIQPEVLKSYILAIRNALGDKSSSPRFIETQRGRGYRFIGKMDNFTSLPENPEATVDLGIFAGRAEPLRDLLALLQRAASREPQAVFISGEPGIGKTTLVQQFLAQAHTHTGFALAQGHCVEGFAGGEPYYPVFEALDDLCKSTPSTRVVNTLLTLAPSWAAQMPAQIPSDQRSALHQQTMPGARSRMVREACNLFETLALARPLVLLLEDLHWADFATIDFLSALCRRRSATKLILVATYCPEDVKTARHPLKQITRDLALRKYCSEIELAPLSTAAIGELLTGRTEDAEVTPEFTQFIKERTSGNPLFMRVTLDYLVQRGDVTRTAHGWRPLAPLNKLASTTPPTLRRAIETKIEGMTKEQRRVLEAASVAGDHFDPATTARAAEIDEQSFEMICESFASWIIRPDKLLTLPNNQLVRTYAFNHVVYRQVLYDGIGQLRRAYLHRVLGERLEEVYPPDQRSDLAIRLAQHFSFARDWSRALDYLRTALRVANGRSARRDALAILDRAFELASNLADNARMPAEIEFLERRASIEAAAHDPKAQETYMQLLEKARQYGDVDVQCRALEGVSNALSWHDLVRSGPFIDKALALCEKQADPIRQDVTRVTAYVRRLWGFGWNRADAQRCEDALIRLKKHGDQLSIARAQANFSMLCILSTRYREALDLVDESYRVLSQTPQNMVEADVARIVWMHHIGIPWALFSLGNFGGALQAFDAGIASFEKNGDISAAHSLRIYRSILLFHACDFEGVVEACASVANSPTGYGEPTLRILPVERRIALIFCGLAEAGLKNNIAALNYLRAAESEMERQPVHLDWYWRLALGWGMTNLLISHGDRSEMLASAKRLCDQAAQTDERAWQAMAEETLARATLSCGEAAEAVNHALKALAACEGVQIPLAEWRVHTTTAMIYQMLGDASRATEHFRMAAAIRTRLAGSLPENHFLPAKFERRSEPQSTL
jgi:DNA-binding winged helix-turn-helix (wHTH) protein